MFRGGIALVDAAGRHRPVRRSTSWSRCSCCAGGAARDKDFPRYARFVNALIETSLPSVIIFVLSRHMEPQTRVRLLAADALFRVHRAVDPAARFLAVAVDRRGRGRPAVRCWSCWLLPLEPYGRRAGADADLPSQPQRRAAGWPASSPASWPAACAGSSRSRSRPPQRATASPTCSASTSRRPWSIGCWPRQPIRRARCATVCVLFLDIRGFTAMTRTRPADETVALLNDFFAEMIDDRRPQQRHHQQVPGRRLPGAVRRAAGGSHGGGQRAGRGARHAGCGRSLEPGAAAARRCASASASISARR